MDLGSYLHLPLNLGLIRCILPFRMTRPYLLLPSPRLFRGIYLLAITVSNAHSYPKLILLIYLLVVVGLAMPQLHSAGSVQVLGMWVLGCFRMGSWKCGNLAQGLGFSGISLMQETHLPQHSLFPCSLEQKAGEWLGFLIPEITGAEFALCSAGAVGCGPNARAFPFRMGGGSNSHWDVCMQPLLRKKEK